MREDSHIQEIMLRYLNGESTGEETEIFQEWLEESPDHSEEFNVVKSLWSDSADAALIDVDTEKAWQAVEAQTIEQHSGVVKLFPWKKALAVAASIILIVGVVYFFSRPAQTAWKVTLAKDGNKIIRLSDGTVISLRQGSKLSLPENYEEEVRKVRLEGVAYFEVKHNAENPFMVITPNSVIRDIGTAFLVKSSDSLSRVTVVEGEVSFAAKMGKSQSIQLRAGESAVLKNNIPEREEVDTANVLSWKSKILIFNNTPLSQVADDLENYYAIHVEAPDELLDHQITAEFNNEPVEQVVRELKLFTSLNFTLKGDTLFISK